jgi:hypothetical protein
MISLKLLFFKKNNNNNNNNNLEFWERKEK